MCKVDGLARLWRAGKAIPTHHEMTVNSNQKHEKETLT